MRYLGNKTKLLGFIEYVINKYKIEGETFADLFSGTGSVGDYFKDKYTIFANDYMSFASIIAKAKLMNSSEPAFIEFYKKYECSPFEWLNEKEYVDNGEYFILNNYTPKADRMYFTEENALKIDGIRIEIEELYKDDLINEAEYYFLIASLLESVLKISNTSGTYQAFFKFWDNRALKQFEICPLEIEEKELHGDNLIFCSDANKLVRNISGDIAYIDPPYTITQYTNSYHMLETIVRYDNPVIFGKTGRRLKRTLSGYSNKQKAYYEFEDLFRQINFKHILISYSNQSIISLLELKNLAKKFAKDGKVFVETTNYREYSTNNSSYKGDGSDLKEAIIYFEKDFENNKSPLNYSGSKDQMMPSIIKQLPKHIGTFVDVMGGAFNVGANVVAMDKVYYFEYNKYIFDIIQMLTNTDKNKIIDDVKKVINTFKLEKKNKDSYLNLRNYYNTNDKPTIELFVLSIYAFQNMIRFNSKQGMNTPVGNNEFNEGIEKRILNFKPKTEVLEMINGSYINLNYEDFPKDTVFYFDPPYFITNAEYNDGKRGLEGWTAKDENELLLFLSKLDEAGYKFMLSNVIKHKGKTNHLLIEWVNQHDFNLIDMGKTGIKYPREEVLITNYKIFEE
ncbi:adenine-specific DNA-methyltransferase [Clostridium sp. DSM 8431]|uniref:DNA adenine methylase n=1 Tax=Clostridium sp. DSM 8431 TaxID=1761781 RepID=UPI0008EC1502|nr:DNA adenine methylase [Clostridium sp. DSM 8431]SFU59076.1 adenine-specific DNA-methyltransferase [Clostridium sp. DSM 8431]